MKRAGQVVLFRRGWPSWRAIEEALDQARSGPGAVLGTGLEEARGPVHQQPDDNSG